MLIGHRLFRLASVGFLLTFAVIQLVPFYVALTTALKPKSDLSSQWMPPTGRLYLDNFRIAIEQGGILRAIVNSLVVTSVATVLVCLIGALAAYPLARRGTWVNRVVMLLMLGSIMVPPLSVLVPLYSLMNQLGGVNTYWGIILILVTGQLPLSVFLYAAFIRTVPTALEEAARVDGAGTFRVFFRIVLPLLKPVTATVAILTGVFIWNDYQMSVYMLTTQDVRTIAPAIGSFFSQQSSNLGAAAAASLTAMAPILLAYLFLQRHFIKGMLAGAEK
ncbi:carbohydrate ABC transporter permease [Micromonospora maritima]|uniref:carbohydrate ABC transporter permease n=1 Tax=Micromonospora maritima TaxID=986711 RepID=UPI00157DE2CF|nr:carbohydrate ABC transporter permease [Micromonospora maritima]